jgi:DNA-binding XRE family transcriptional regulator
MIFMYINFTYIGRAGFAVSSPMTKSVFTDAYRALLESLKDARRDAGVSQTELARRLGKPQQFVSFIELGARRVDVIEFYAIMKALGADPGEAFLALMRALPDEVSI